MKKISVDKVFPDFCVKICLFIHKMSANRIRIKSFRKNIWHTAILNNTYVGLFLC